jgi:acyl-CoA synthetase (AMP-forming)/AMP-acid ligase II
MTSSSPRREPTTLVELLARRAREQPKRPAFHFGGRDHTFGELGAGIDRIAALLAGRGLDAGDRVVLVLPNGPEFFAAFYGAQRVGAIPVPIYPESGVDRVVDLAAACGAAAVVVSAEAPAERVAALRQRLGDSGPALLSAGEAPAGGGDPPAPFPRPEQTAFLQYTSGSTGDPKGVAITHAALLTNVGQMIAGMEITADDVFVSWLPVHHDMGLVLMTMVPFFLTARLVLLPTTLADVRQWLRAIAEHRGTFTAAPDFAYRLCLRAVRDPDRFDLRSLRVALNAAEPVRASTLERFEEAFGLERVMVPGYGLAEATVGVSMQPPGTPPVVSERGLVAIGRPFPGVTIHVVAGDRPAATGEVGELVVESPAATAGYFRNPRATAELFWRPGCVRSGDLGYRDGNGDVFLVGRSKNIILQAGRNLAPQEIEEAVDALPFVRRTAAVGIDRGRAEGEQAYVFAELRRAAPPAADELQEMARQVVERVHARLGLRPGRVVLLKPRSIPLTPNGKIQYGALREAHLGGDLQARGRVAFPC